MAVTAVAIRGANVVNNGAITCAAPLDTHPIVASDPVSLGSFQNFNFAGPAAITYSGTGTFGTAGAPFGGGGVGCATSVNLASPIVTNRVNLFSGQFVNSFRITLGNGGSSSTFVQVGSPGASIAGGSFDVAPVHNQGTGGESILYADALARNTSFEINPTRTLTALTMNSFGRVTLTGGDLTLNAVSSTALSLTKGQFWTSNFGNFTLIIANDSGTTNRTNGHVVGNLRKRFAGASTQTFDLGDLLGFYTPVTCAITSGTFPADVTMSVTKAQHPNYPPLYPGFFSGLQRYWTITAPADLIGHLTFKYDQGDLPVAEIESDSNLAHYRNGFFSSDMDTHDSIGNTYLSTDTFVAGIWSAVEDQDFDGMTNSYESLHMLNRGNPADANTDADGDGSTNLSEYFAGTDPRNANDYLHITLAVRDPSGFHADFATGAAKVYRIQYKDSITAPNWSTLPVGENNEFIGSGAIDTFFDLTMPLPATRFYRVLLLRP